MWWGACLWRCISKWVLICSLLSTTVFTPLYMSNAKMRDMLLTLQGPLESVLHNAAENTLRLEDLHVLPLSVYHQLKIIKLFFALDFQRPKYWIHMLRTLQCYVNVPVFCFALLLLANPQIAVLPGRKLLISSWWMATSLESSMMCVHPWILL